MEFSIYTPATSELCPHWGHTTTPKGPRPKDGRRVVISIAFTLFNELRGGAICFARPAL